MFVAFSGVFAVKSVINQAVREAAGAAGCNRLQPGHKMSSKTPKPSKHSPRNTDTEPLRVELRTPRHFESNERYLRINTGSGICSGRAGPLRSLASRTLDRPGLVPDLKPNPGPGSTLPAARQSELKPESNEFKSASRRPGLSFYTEKSSLTTLMV